MPWWPPDIVDTGAVLVSKVMARMEADATDAAWWRITVPCQRPLESRSPGEGWAPPDAVFHRD